MASTADIWVVIEHRGGALHEVTPEMLGEARRLAPKLGTGVAAVAVGSDLGWVPSAITPYGADVALLLDAPFLECYTTDSHVSALEALVQARAPRLLLIAATPNGSDVAPRLAARLGVGLATGCTAVSVDADACIQATRPAYRHLQETVRFGPRQPAIATIRPGAIGAERPAPGRLPLVEPIELDAERCGTRSRVLGVLEPDPATVDLSDADVVVAGGRGVGGPGEWHVVEELAEALGAALGGSRVAADQGCIPAERVIGQSGRVIAPRLYVAAGISGASQHVSGVRDVRCIVAVNRDRGAPIRRIADLALIGDLHEVLPLATTLIREERERTRTTPTG